MASFPRKRESILILAFVAIVGSVADEANAQDNFAGAWRIEKKTTP
jgi:hypothetical protein